MSEENWIEVGSTDSIEEEDLIRFDPVSYTHLTLPTIAIV